MDIRYTLLSDGSSDKILLPILSFVLRENAEWADLGRIRRLQQTLAAKIKTAVEWYPCDLLFVHRDSETAGYDFRKGEISDALRESAVDVTAVPVVPVRMTEAWLLFDEVAIRKAGGKPGGTVPLELPAVRRSEDNPNPKDVLHKALRDASEHRGRRLRDFAVRQRVHQVAEIITDYSVLRQLPAFQALERDVESAMRQIAAGGERQA